MFPDGDTKFASLTVLGGDDVGGVAAEPGGDATGVSGDPADAGGDETAVSGSEAPAGGASPSAAFVATGGCAGGEFCLPPEAEHAARAAASVIAPHNPAQPRADAMSPPKAE